MNKLIKTGVLASTVVFAAGALAAELETEAQKLGYVFGMEIGGHGLVEQARHQPSPHVVDLERHLRHAPRAHLAY